MEIMINNMCDTPSDQVLPKKTKRQIDPGSGISAQGVQQTTKRQRQLIVYLCVSVVGCLTFFCTSFWLCGERERLYYKVSAMQSHIAFQEKEFAEKVKLLEGDVARKKEELEGDVARKKEEMDKQVNAIIEGASAQAKKMTDEAHMLALREQQRLYEHYPELHKYMQGDNNVLRRYVKSFRIDGNTAVITLVNHTAAPIKPNVDISFLNAGGFKTDGVEVSWVFDTIGPGEVRVENKRIQFAFGEPSYYLVKFH
jgi:hypothetical protein